MGAFWIWWIAAAALIGAELLTGTFYLLAVGSAAAIGGLAAWLGVGSAWQFVIAGVLGVGSPEPPVSSIGSVYGSYGATSMGPAGANSASS